MAEARAKYGRVPLFKINKVDQLMLQAPSYANLPIFLIPKVKSTVKFLVKQAKTLGIVPKGLEGRGHRSLRVRDSPAVWRDILRYHGRSLDLIGPGEDEASISTETQREREYLLFELLHEVLVANLQQDNVVDFGDQVYFPVVKQLHHPLRSYDAIFVDEVLPCSHPQGLIRVGVP